MILHPFTEALSKCVLVPNGTQFVVRLFVWSVCSWIIYFRFELDEETSAVNAVASTSVCEDVVLTFLPPSKRV